MSLHLNKSALMITANALVLLFLVAVVHGYSQQKRSTQQILECEQLILRDAEKKVRATLSVDGDGTAALRLFDNNNIMRNMSWASSDDVSGFSVHDSKGNRRTQVSVKGGTSSIFITDTNNKLLLSIQAYDPVDEKNLKPDRVRASIAAFDGAEQSRFELRLYETGESALLMKDNQGGVKSFVSVDERGSGNVAVYDPTGKDSMIMGRTNSMIDNDQPTSFGLGAFDEGGLRFLLDPTDKDDPNLRLVDPDGTPAFQAIGQGPHFIKPPHSLPVNLVGKSIHSTK